MVFSDDDKAIIANDFDEFGLNAYQIWKRHHLKNWKYTSVKRLLNGYKLNGNMRRKKGSGRPVTVTTEENQDLVEETICSQENDPHSHQSPREIAETTGISRTSVRRIASSKGITNFKRVKTPSMNAATRQRRARRAQALAKRYAKNKRMVEKTVWQDEKDFPLHVPVNAQNDRVYYKGSKKDVPDANLFKETKKLSKKVMVSAGISWYGATKPFFVSEKGVKVNGPVYHKHLRTELFPAISKLVKKKRLDLCTRRSAITHIKSRSRIFEGHFKKSMHNEGGVAMAFIRK